MYKRQLLLLATPAAQQVARPGLDLPVMPASIFEGLAGSPLLHAQTLPSAAVPAGAPALHGSLDLGGTWRYRADPQELGEAQGWMQPDHDDGDWDAIPVPSNYSRFDPALADYFGPVWFRTELELPAGWDDRHLVLRFHGVDYFARVWVNGLTPAAGGEHEGCFTPFEFDVTELLQPGTNVLAVRVTNPFDYGQVQGGQAAIYPTLGEKVWVKGILNHHDTRPGGNSAGPEMQTLGTGGIAQPVELASDGGARVRWAFLTPRLTRDRDRAELLVDLFLENAGAAPATVRLVLAAQGDTFAGGAVSRVLEATLPPGTSRVETVLELAQPRLWFPWDQPQLGRPDLYRFTADVLAGGTVLHSWTDRFGVRDLRYSDLGSEPYIFYVNGRRTFLRGSNSIPGQWFSELDRETHERDADLAIAAGMNALRVHAHVSTPELYEVADERGLLLLQDMGLQWAYSLCAHERPNGDPALTDNREVIARMLAELLYRHYNRPSIVQWILHNEPLWVFTSGGVEPSPAPGPPLLCSGPYSQANPQPFGTDLSLGAKLDLLHLRPTADALERSRPIHTASGFGDTHVYDGWYSKLYTDLFQVSGPMITEFGAQAAPFRAEEFMAAEPLLGGNWWPPATDQQKHVWRLHDAQLQSFGMFVGRAHLHYGSYPEWAFATQLYQAHLLEYAVHHFRAQRYAPTGTVIFFQFQNWWDSFTWGVVDADRTAYLAHETLARAMAPRAFFVHAEHNVHVRGEPLSFQFHAVNDVHEARTVTLSARLFEETDSFLLRGDPSAVLDFGIPGDDPSTWVALPVDSLTVARGSGEAVAELPSAAVLHTALLPADGHAVLSSSPDLDPSLSGPRSYTWLLEMTDAQTGELLHEGWHHFLVVDDAPAFAASVLPGIHPEPRFDLELVPGGAHPLQVTVTRRYAEEQVFSGPLPAAFTLKGLPPGIYRVEAGPPGGAPAEQEVSLLGDRSVVVPGS